MMKTFLPEEKVATEKMSCYNRLGIQIVAGLCHPNGMHRSWSKDLMQHIAFDKPEAFYKDNLK